MIEIDDVVATTVFYADYENPSLQLKNHYQEIYFSLPLYLTVNLARKSFSTLPLMGFIKIYGLNIRKSLSMKCRSKANSNVTLTCIRHMNYYRAECSLCLSNGRCLKGELSAKLDDYLCLCPRCHYVKMCEYSSELMSFSLDSLIVKDMKNNHRMSSGIYISMAILIFFFGLFNNLCSFVTFCRPKPRKFGVGNYLLIVSIVDQCSLLLLFLKVIDMILGTNGILFHYETLNRYSCKIISSLLSVLTRLTYWLTSFVTIERLLMVIFPTSSRLKNSRFALTLSFFVILTMCGMHVHEALYYTTVVDPSDSSSKITLCVTNYTQSIVSTYNRINVLIHYFIPFLIQMVSITIMIIQIAISRARTGNLQHETFLNLFKKQLKTQKELYITPMIIILSSLPQIILSFSYACQPLKQSWQLYSLLIAYFLSYLPQILGFILYVLPSTTFYEEFRQTMIGKRFQRPQQRNSPCLRK